MGLFDKFKKAAAPAKPAPVACQTAPHTVCAPASGEVRPLAEAPDPVFAQGMLGQGLVIKPSGDTVYAPFDGTVSVMMGSGHAAGLVSTDGVDVLIHVGVDTVQMNGDGFKMFVKQGDSVKAGEPIIHFDRAKIAKAGHPDEIMVLISNTADYAAVKPVDPKVVQAGEAVITVE